MKPLDDLALEDRLITPSQAIRLKELFIKQVSVWAWKRHGNNEFSLCYEPDAVSGSPIKPFDWAQEEDCYAAFDCLELDVMLQSLGYFICGPIHKQFTVPVQGREDINVGLQWWCDDIINVCDDTTESFHAVYAEFPAQAKGLMLIKQLETDARITINWPYYVENRLNLITKGQIKVYGKPPKKDD